MYAGSRYGLTRYSVNRAYRPVEVEAQFAASLTALAGAAVPVPFGAQYWAGLQSRALASLSAAVVLSAQGELWARAQLSADVAADSAFCAALSASLSGGKNIPAALGAQETMASSAWGAKNTPAALLLAARLDGSADGVKNVPAAMPSAGVFSVMTRATIQTIQRAVFDVVIPPGGELRIDSGLFTVLLDGENMLHTQAGDWVNLSRELLCLTLESASGGPLQGQIIYQERYL